MRPNFETDALAELNADRKRDTRDTSQGSKREAREKQERSKREAREKQERIKRGAGECRRGSFDRRIALRRLVASKGNGFSNTHLW